jgi:hypothetical protein
MNQGMGSDGASPSPFTACLGKSVLIKTELLRWALEVVADTWYNKLEWTDAGAGLAEGYGMDRTYKALPPLTRLAKGEMQAVCWRGAQMTLLTYEEVLWKSEK